MSKVLLYATLCLFLLVFPPCGLVRPLFTLEDRRHMRAGRQHVCELSPSEVVEAPHVARLVAIHPRVLPAEDEVDPVVEEHLHQCLSERHDRRTVAAHHADRQSAVKGTRERTEGS